MSATTDFATLTVSWEQSDAPLGRPVAVEIAFRPADVEAVPEARLPLNIGLAIDRSGSMSGEKLHAARQAAIGVLESLGDGERFAVAAFDHEVIDVCSSVRVDHATRVSAGTRIAGLHSGGSTALFDGFARAAELVAMGGNPATCDSWVIVLSDGMGNHGVVDPVAMRAHAAGLAERGIRAITVGIGADYRADQLTALADGGSGEFHHATQPDEIVEIVLGEIGALRHTTARGLCLRTGIREVSRFLLLGGDVRPYGGATETRFDRIAAGRVARALLLLWPSAAGAAIMVDASWTNADQSSGSARVEACAQGPATRDLALAGRAAQLWHASILARALELNERGDYRAAQTFTQDARRDFAAYVDGLPGCERLLATLDRVEDRVGRRWSTIAHKEAYSMNTKMMRGKADLRDSAPDCLEAALALDDE